MRLWLHPCNILTVFVTLTTVQAKDVKIPNDLKILDHFVGDRYNETIDKPANGSSGCGKCFLKKSMIKILKNYFILGREVSQPNGMYSLRIRESDDAKKDSEKLQGTWAVVSYIKSGKGEEKLIDPEDSILRFSFNGDKINVYEIVHQSHDKGTFKLDPSKMPNSIDLTFPPIQGNKKDQTLHGIYKFDGDTLIICYRLDEEERPTEFKSKAGSKTIMVTLKQLKK